jgi:hypothetical protein
LRPARPADRLGRPLTRGLTSSSDEASLGFRPFLAGGAAALPLPFFVDEADLPPLLFLEEGLTSLSSSSLDSAEGSSSDDDAAEDDSAADDSSAEDSSLTCAGGRARRRDEGRCQYVRPIPREEGRRGRGES